MTIDNPIIKKPRMAYLDLFRLIAAIAVVVIHLTASVIGQYNQGSTLQLGVTLINGLALFAVPAFIFISGYTFMVIYRGKQVSFLSFLKKRTLVLLLPYIGWSLVYYADQLYFSAAPFSLTGFVYTLMTGSAFYHLYFMPIIFQFYLLFIPLKALAERFSPLWLGLGTLVLYYVYTNGFSIKALIPLSDRFFMSYLPFYFLGMLMGLHCERVQQLLSRYWALAVGFYLLATAFHVAGRTAYYVYQANMPLVLPFAWELASFGAILMLLLLTQRTEPLYQQNSLVPQLSSYTFDLYLAHPLVLQIGEILLRRIGVQSVSIRLVILLMAGIGLPLAFSHIKNMLNKKARTA